MRRSDNGKQDANLRKGIYDITIYGTRLILYDSNMTQSPPRSGTLGIRVQLSSVFRPWHVWL